MGATINQWQFPENEAGKVVGWSDSGRELVNRDAGLGGVRRITTVAALKAATDGFSSGDYVIVEGRAAANDGGGGVYRYSSADLSADFVRSTISILTGEIDAATNKINKTAHGLRTGQGVLVTAGDGLTANTVVYYVRGRLPDEFTFHPTYLDAVAATNTVDITGTTAFSVKVLADPDQVGYVVLTGRSLDGSEGGFLNSDAKKRRRWHVEWFPGSGPDDTDQINRAILAAGTGGEVYFPDDTLVISNRDTDDVCLWQLSGQVWFGNDRETAILQLSSSVTDTQYVIRAIDGAENFVMRDMCIDGNRDNVVPAVDIYSNFNLVVGPSGGGHGRYRRLNLINSWGRTLQTGDETGSEYAEDMLVEDVKVLNAGTKALSITKTRGGKIENCYVEVNAYTVAENPAGTAAASGSCFEVNDGFDIHIRGNRGHQIGATVRAPGIRFINAGKNLWASNNSIDGATYLGFIQNVNDVDFANNVGRDIQGNGILISDGDAAETVPCKGIHVHHNRIVNPTSAYVFVDASKSGTDAFVECYIYHNTFEQSDAGAPQYGIYNNGVIAPATGGLCEVYQWGNRFVGTIPSHFTGPADYEIMPSPDAGWQIIQQSNVAVSHTGDTNETILATVVIDPHHMGINGRLRITATWSYTNSANNKITRFRFGGSQAHAATLTTTAQHRAQIEIGNRNAANSQVVLVPGVTSGWGSTTTAVATMAIDTSASTNATLTGTLANSGETITLESYVVEVYHAN